MIEVALTVLVMLVLLLLEGFFSGSEIALVNADKLILREKARKGDIGAELALRLFEHPERLLTATLIGTNLCMVSFTTLGTVMLIRWFGEFGDVLAIAILTPLVLVFGEVVPKSIYQQKADLLAPLIVFPLRWVSVLLYPLILVFSGAARLAALAVHRGEPKSLFVAREKVRLMLDSAAQVESGAVIDRRRIKRALRFSEVVASEAMIPLAEIVSIGVDRSIEAAIALVRRHGFNRLPVFESDASRIVGVVVLTTWDLLDPQVREQSLTERVRPARYVAANEPVEDLLGALRERADHMGIVVDEFGSAIGLITLEDILEEVVGEIEDVDFRIHHARVRSVTEIADGVWEVDARLPIAELNEMLSAELDTREYHSVSGLMTARLKHIPQIGETIDAHDYRFTVTAADERSALTVRVERMSDRGRSRRTAESDRGTKAT